MTVPARDDLNGTEIHCRTAGSDGNIVYSNYSWLKIVGMSIGSTLPLLCTRKLVEQLSLFSRTSTTSQCDCGAEQREHHETVHTESLPPEISINSESQTIIQQHLKLKLKLQV